MQDLISWSHRRKSSRKPNSFFAEHDLLCAACVRVLSNRSFQQRHCNIPILPRTRFGWAPTKNSLNEEKVFLTSSYNRGKPAAGETRRWAQPLQSTASPGMGVLREKEINFVKYAFGLDHITGSATKLENMVERARKSSIVWVYWSI